MHQRNAASVFPEPVGAQMSVCRPLEIAGQPSAWACVGPSNADRNQACVAGVKSASGSAGAAAGAGRERLAKGRQV